MATNFIGLLVILFVIICTVSYTTEAGVPITTEKPSQRHENPSHHFIPCAPHYPHPHGHGPHHSDEQLGHINRCPPDRYGPNCNKYCEQPNIKKGEYYYCSSRDGSKKCCPNFYNQPACDVFCKEGDTYTCHNETGRKICHADWYSYHCDLFCNSTIARAECRWPTVVNETDLVSNNTLHCSCRLTKSHFAFSKLQIGALCSLASAIILLFCTISLAYKLRSYKRSTHGTLRILKPAAAKTFQFMSATSGIKRSNRINSRRGLLEANPNDSMPPGYDLNEVSKISVTPASGRTVLMGMMRPSLSLMSSVSTSTPPGFEERRVVENHYVEDNIGIRRVGLVDFGYVDMAEYLEHDYRIGRNGEYHQYDQCSDVPTV